MTLTKCVGQIKPFLAVVGNNVTSKTDKQTNKQKKKKKKRNLWKWNTETGTRTGYLLLC